MASRMLNYPVNRQPEPVASSEKCLIFGTSRDTSDFMADCLESWWDNRRSVYPCIRRLQIDLDNGPEISSSRTQFMR